MEKRVRFMRCLKIKFLKFLATILSLSLSSLHICTQSKKNQENNNTDPVDVWLVGRVGGEVDKIHVELTRGEETMVD